MLLTIDVGNTNTVFGIYEGDELTGTFRVKTDSEKTSDEIIMQIASFYSFQNISPKDTKAVVISSVVPPVMHSLKNACKGYFKLEPFIVGENIDHGMVNLYDNKKEVGADRLVNAVYAVKKYGTPLIIVDIGTATTFDVVSKNGEYLGGAIFPGMKVSMEALFAKAAKLPRVDISMPEKVIGTSTVKSIRSGAMHGYIGAIEGIINGIKSELDGEPLVVATGGMARMFSEYMDIFAGVDKNMTLEGLKEIYLNHIKNS